MQSPVRPGTVARREGLIFGAGLGILLCLNFLLGVYASFGFTVITWVVSFGVYFWAGMRAGKASHVTSAGLLAGLFTGVVSSVINLVVVLVVTLLDTTHLRIEAQKLADQVKNNTTHYTNSSYLSIVIFGLFFGIVLAALFGIGLGSAGGALGRARAPLPTQPYEESMYQGVQPPQQ